MSNGAIIAVGALGVMVCCSSSVAAVMMGGDGESNVGKVCTPHGTPDPNATYKYGANDVCLMTCKTGYEKKDGACVEKNPSPAPAPCAGLTDTSPASSVPVSCLRKLLTDEGCTSSGTVWPGDDYDGWWRQDDGAGNYGVVKSDIKFWATSTDPTRVAGCGSTAPSSSSGSLTFHSSTLPTDATIVEPGEITSVIKSPNNEYSLVLQGDDNLCVRGPTEAKWCLMSQDLVNGRAHFQGDGNLCVYGDNGSMCTASHDLDVPSGQHRLVLKNNGTMYVDHGTGVSGQSLVTNW